MVHGRGIFVDRIYEEFDINLKGEHDIVLLFYMLSWRILEHSHKERI